MKMTAEEKADGGSGMKVEDVQKLIQKKDEIEEQIRAYYDVLEDQGDVGMSAALVDVEGYPRADVDLYQIRTARHSISCLQNDHKAIMLRIEESLHRLHAQERAGPEGAGPRQEPMEQEAVLPPPFAHVDAVTPGSPAFQAGLRAGDEIIEFGSVNAGNFQHLQNIASVVQHSEGKSLGVAVVRSGQRVHFSLVPQRWSGRGLLGCNILPARK
ncbi:26S proteasome non-ATPase regulatory subunit 9-like [Denticeps clupeoides]|uniref:26S proteasome non-ATPase regulatory subunit 9 n=1 Tax=Denticeps clupeoides TaxID=299321 RepID=A0A8C3ZR48_9TELE|nr:26S proteasome non-ATPase regulatory subunit 9-like [Denticeps clupeoides]XP_028853115.1 26S proteasome non-ATPase regulatory subunit 9-like [Denticeps clupeoides]